MSQLEEEKLYYVSRWGVKGLQAGCLAAIPIYAVQVVRKGNFSLRNLARYNWTVPLVGGAGGAAYGLTTSSTSDPASVIAKSNQLRFDSNRVRMDDMHLIGGAVGALLLPAIFLRRVGLVNGALGGLGLGGSAGLITHAIQKYGTDGIAEKGEDLVHKGEKVAQDAQNWGEKAWQKGQEKLNKGGEKLQQGGDKLIEGKQKIEKELK